MSAYALPGSFPPFSSEGTGSSTSTTASSSSSLSSYFFGSALQPQSSGFFFSSTSYDTTRNGGGDYDLQNTGSTTDDLDIGDVNGEPKSDNIRDGTDPTSSHAPAVQVYVKDARMDISMLTQALTTRRASKSSSIFGSTLPTSSSLLSDDYLSKYPRLNLIRKRFRQRWMSYSSNDSSSSSSSSSSNNNNDRQNADIEEETSHNNESYHSDQEEDNEYDNDDDDDDRSTGSMSHNDSTSSTSTLSSTQRDVATHFELYFETQETEVDDDDDNDDNDDQVRPRRRVCGTIVRSLWHLRKLRRDLVEEIRRSLLYGDEDDESNNDGMVHDGKMEDPDLADINCTRLYDGVVDEACTASFSSTERQQRRKQRNVILVGGELIPNLPSIDNDGDTDSKPCWCKKTSDERVVSLRSFSSKTLALPSSTSQINTLSSHHMTCGCCSSFKGSGFWLMHQMLQNYAPRLEAWLRRVLQNVSPRTSPVLAAFLEIHHQQRELHRHCEAGCPLSPKQQQQQPPPSRAATSLRSSNRLDTPTTASHSVSSKKKNRRSPTNKRRVAFSTTRLDSIVESSEEGDMDHDIEMDVTSEESNNAVLFSTPSE